MDGQAIAGVEIRTIALASIEFSKTRGQAERRAHLDKAKLAELAESIKSKGLIQPIVVRRPTLADPRNPAVFELVAGERSHSAEQSKRQKAAKRETEFRAAVYAAVRPKLPSEFGRQDLEALAETAFSGLGYDSAKPVIRAQAWTDKKGKLLEFWNVSRDLRPRLAKMSAAQLSTFMFDCMLAGDLSVNSYRMDKPAKLLAIAKRVRVDAGKIKREIDAAAKAKKKPKARKPK